LTYPLVSGESTLFEKQPIWLESTGVTMDGIGIGNVRAGRSSLLVAGALVGLLFALWAVSGPIANASAGSAEFCGGYLAAPYGQNGDRCSDPNFHLLNGVSGKGGNHSACVDALNTSGNLITSWVCSSGANVEVSLGTCCGQTLRGIVRNNTTGDTNHLWGWDIY
jgi:hypothetical protein